MNFSLNEDQKAFRDTAAAYAARELAPHAAQWDRDCTFPAQALRAGAELGFGGLFVRTEMGGAELGRLDAVAIFEELAKACTSTAAFVSIHNMSAWMIDRFAGNDLRARLLPALTSMQTFAAYCLTEPGTGSDAASLTTRAERDGGHFVLNGEKAFISGGGVSDVYLCMVRTGGPGARGISCLAVEKDTPGLSFGAQEKKLGWHSQPTAAVIFQDCRVPVANMIGAEGEGFKLAMAALDGGRVNIAACSLGAAQVCLERAVAYMGERRQFGGPLSALQALRFRIADMASDLEAARLMVYRAASMLDSDDPGRTAAAAMAKRMATDTGFEVVNQAMQIHGGYGYLADYGIERYLRDTRVHQILEGSNEVMRLIIARDILGR